MLSLAEVEPVANDAALSVSSPGVIVSRVAYDKNENVQLVTKPEGNQLAYLYDERQLPYQVIDGFGSPEAGVYTFTYNANGSMVYAVDAEKNNPGKDPGVSGDVTRVHIDGFDETFCVWDAESNFGLSVFDPTGARVRYVRFGPSEEGNPRLSEVEFLHDELGRRFQTEARIFETQVTGGAAVMDFSIPVIGGSVPAGESEAIHLSEFDRLGRVIRGIDAKGDEALLDYDGASRLLRAQGPVFASRAGTGATRNEVSYAYNQASQVVRVLQTDRSPVQADEAFEYLRVYDAVGRLVRATDPVGQTSRLAYDSRSNVIAASDAQSSVLTGDPLGLFAGQINGHGNVVQVRYDGIGRPIQSDLALKAGGVGNGSLDLLGWTGLDTSNPANADGLITKRMRYDRNSRLLSQTDDNGNTTGSIYDARDRVTHSVAADLTARQVVYDRDSMVRQSIDRNGTVVSRTYDGIGRLMTAEVTKQATGLEGLAQNVEGTTLQAWEYDGLSRLRVAFDNNGPGADDVACSYTWDSLSRKTSERHRFNVLGGVTGATTTSGRVSVTPTGATLDRTVASQYDVDSNRVGLTYSSGRQLTFGIDGADRLQEISDGGGVIAGWEFVGGRPVVCGLRNGVQTNFGYDAKRRVTSVDHVGVVAFGYGWDRANRRTFETQSPGRTETYGYDSAYRVTSVGFSDGTPTTSYQIDGVGNWVTRVEGGETTEFNRRTNGSYAFDVMSEQFRTATYDQAGSLVAENTPVSDPNGNRINNGGKKLVFDAFDRLLRVEEVGGSTVATYRYDVAGRRTQKTTSSEDTYYVSDGAREIEELAANGAVQADYVFGGYVDHVVQMRSSGGEYYLHQDSTFSVAAVTNAAGAVVTRYAYGSIYGTSSISAGSDVGNPWRFQGRRWDPESGFYQFRNRYLDPAAGRFVSRDPLGLWGDASNLGNGYAFCGNDPVNEVDPFGLEGAAAKHARLGRNEDPIGDATVQAQSDLYQALSSDNAPRSYLSVERAGNVIVSTIRLNLIPGTRRGRRTKKGTLKGAAELAQTMQDALDIINLYSPTFEDPSTGESFRISFVGQITVSEAPKPGYFTVKVYQYGGRGRENRAGHDTLETMAQGSPIETVLHEFVHFMGTKTHEDPPYFGPAGFMSGAAMRGVWSLWTRYYRMFAWVSLARVKGFRQGDVALLALMWQAKENSRLAGRPHFPNLIDLALLQTIVENERRGKKLTAASFRTWYWLQEFLRANPCDEEVGSSQRHEGDK